MTKVLIVGPGQAGRSLALVHARRGDSVLLLGRRPGPWQAWARRHHIHPALTLSGEERRPRIVILAVADRDLPSAARTLAGVLAPSPERLAIHLSGWHGLAPLQPLQRRGAHIAALHPLVPFAEPTTAARALQGASVTVCAPPAARRRAGALVRRWGARPLLLAGTAERRRYHLALSLAANHLTALLGWAEQLLEPALGRRARAVCCELAARAVQATALHGPGRALTGPVVRGDLEVVRSHLQALGRRERVRYLALLDAVLDLAERSGRLGPAAARPWRKLGKGR